MRTILLSALIFITMASTCVAEDSRNPQDWYRRAQADFEVAELLLNQTTHYSIVCFHAHQAAEKALKGALISRNISPDKFHYTAELAESLSKFVPDANNLVAPCEALDKLYVPSRYPKSGGGEFTHELASSCVQNAKPVLDLVVKEDQVEISV